MAVLWSVQATTYLCTEQSLSKELHVFRPFLGQWQANFPVKKNSTAMQDVSQWARALNGTAVRTLHSINEGEYGGESLIFWDKTKQKLVFYYFTTAGFYTQGTIEALPSGGFTAYEFVKGNQEGITQVKSTTHLRDNKMRVATQYLKNKQWTQPHTRTYIRSEKVVKFK